MATSFRPHIERDRLDFELNNSNNTPKLILINFGMNKQSRNWWFVQNHRLHYCNIRNKANFDPEKKLWNVTLQCCNSRPPISCKFCVKMTYQNVTFDKDEISFFDMSKWTMVNGGNFDHRKLSPPEHIHKVALKATKMDDVYCDKSSESMYCRCVRGVTNSTSYNIGRSTVLEVFFSVNSLYFKALRCLIITKVSCQSKTVHLFLAPLGVILCKELQTAMSIKKTKMSQQKSQNGQGMAFYNSFVINKFIL